MYDILNVYQDGAEEPVEVKILTADVWTYNDLTETAGKKAFIAGMQLTVAYCQLVDPDPKNLGVVKKWAREHAVQCEVRETVGPTQSDPPAD
jgi:hypothetical protein